MSKLRCLLTGCLCAFVYLFFSSPVFAQKEDSTSVYSKVLSFPDKLFGAIDKKSRQAEQQLDKGTDKYLHKLARQENKLHKRLLKKDPQLALSLFPSSIDSTYKALKSKATQSVSKYSSVYSGHLDSLTTALSFLKSSNISNLTNNPEVTKALQNYKALQDKLNGTEQIKKYIEQRQQLLKEQFQRLGMVKGYKQFQQQVYYYKAQVQEYKQSFEDPSKLEAKLLEVLNKVPQFKDFFARNSQLASLFALPSSSSASTASLTGLQTRAMLDQTLQGRFGSGTNVTQMLQQNVQAAQGQLSELQGLKDKVSGLSSGSYGNSSSDPSMPDFKPNNQKTKSFLKRLELGSNIQSEKAQSIFPVTTDIGLSVGYKLNDKSVIGVGGSYKIGWGSGFQNIRITHQGVGVRSFMDWKLKGSFWVSGGYEMNYRNLIHSFDQLKDYSSWQRSGLIGLTKQYQVSKKVKGTMQLLWDFLSYQQVPHTQPILFRIGYNLK